MSSQHDYATSTHLPNLGSGPQLSEIVDELTDDEINSIRDYADRNGNGMYGGGEAVEAIENYRNRGETGTVLIDQQRLRKLVLDTAINEDESLERFLYAELEGEGEFKFHGEGEYKRVHHDREKKKAIIEGKEQNYTAEDQRKLLEANKTNHSLLSDARSVSPPSNKEPEVFEHSGTPLMRYGFNDSIVPIHELSDDEMDKIESQIKAAEREMRMMIDSNPKDYESFETVQPEDFQFLTGPERAQSHLMIPEEKRDSLEEIEGLIVSDLGEIQKSFDNGRDDIFAQ